MNDLKPDERIEDLQYGGLKIIQSASEYRFTTDAVLLANLSLIHISEPTRPY